MQKKLLCCISFIFLVVGCHERNAIDSAQVREMSKELIAFSRLTGDYWQIWTIRPDGSDLKQVTASNIDKRYPVWDASGKELLFRNNSSQAFKVALTSGKEQEILQEMDLVSSPVISPDGTELLFTRYRTELKDSGNLWLASLDGQKARILTREKGIQYDPDWSSNGNWIVYISGHGYRTGEVYILNLANKETRRLTDNNYRELLPVFSPDSKKIAYSADTTGNYEIWTMNTDGSNRMQLTNAEGIDTRPYWSPDGKKLVFVSNRSGTLQLWIMDSNGNNIRQLTSGAPSMDPCWRSNNAK